MPVSVCFVCLGNICRSPTAEGIMRALVQARGLAAEILVDSAGTSAGHAGEHADARSRATAELHGIDLCSISRQFQLSDLDRFDYIIAMDRSNARNLHRLAQGRDHRNKIHLLRSFEPEGTGQLDVPDPYYNDGFDLVFDICEAGCQGLLDHLITAHGLLPRSAQHN